MNCFNTLTLALLAALLIINPSEGVVRCSLGGGKSVACTESNNAWCKISFTGDGFTSSFRPKECLPDKDNPLPTPRASRGCLFSNQTKHLPQDLAENKVVIDCWCKEDFCNNEWDHHLPAFLAGRVSGCRFTGDHTVPTNTPIEIPIDQDEGKSICPADVSDFCFAKFNTEDPASAKYQKGCGNSTVDPVLQYWVGPNLETRPSAATPCVYFDGYNTSISKTKITCMCSGISHCNHWRLEDAVAHAEANANPCEDHEGLKQACPAPRAGCQTRFAEVDNKYQLIEGTGCAHKYPNRDTDKECQVNWSPEGKKEILCFTPAPTQFAEKNFEIAQKKSGGVNYCRHGIRLILCQKPVFWGCNATFDFKYGTQFRGCAGKRPNVTKFDYSIPNQSCNIEDNPNSDKTIETEKIVTCWCDNQDACNSVTEQEARMILVSKSKGYLTTELGQFFCIIFPIFWIWSFFI